MSKKLLIAFGLLCFAVSAAIAQPPATPRNGAAGLGAPTVNSTSNAVNPPAALTPVTAKEFSIPPYSGFPGAGQTAAPAGYETTAVSTSSCTFDRAGCADACRRWSDNLSIYAGIDSAKEPADVGINSNFGYRFAGNLGLPLMEDAGLGLQVGTALNHSNNSMRIMRFIDGTTEHTQSFTTVGVFQRTERGLNWGVVYDYRWDDYYDRFATSQWRAQVGMDVGTHNEIGMWGTLRQGSARAELAGLPLTLTPLNQLNFYWRHLWPNDAATRVWVGFTENHGRFSFFSPFETPVRHPFCFGGDLHIPLNESLAIFAEAQFITPNDSGTVCATLGIAWHPGAARRAARARFAPYQNVANNTTMPLDLRAKFDVIAVDQ